MVTWTYVLLLLQAFSFNSEAANTFSCSFALRSSSNSTQQMVRIANIALTRSYERSDEDLRYFFQYKNNNINPKTVNLSIKNILANLTKTNQRQKIKTLFGTITEFELQILSLKKGDTVVFDDKSFVLGSFIGAGNGTHVFNSVSPEGALRLPFLADFIQLRTSNEKRRTNHILRQFSLSMDKLLSKKNAVEVLDRDRFGRYALVELIHSSETGAHLLTRLGRQMSGSDEDLHKLKKLRKLMQINGELEGDEDAINFSEMILEANGEARQYVWNPDLDDWIRIDGY